MNGSERHPDNWGQDLETQLMANGRATHAQTNQNCSELPAATPPDVERGNQMTLHLGKSLKPRDVENKGSRFWIVEVENTEWVFGSSTVGIVDENEGGIVLYCHTDNAEEIMASFRQTSGEV